MAYVGSVAVLLERGRQEDVLAGGMSSVADDQLLLGADEAVDVVQPVVLDVQRVAAEAGPEREQHALRAGVRDVDERLDHERSVAGVDRLPLPHRRVAGEVYVAVARRAELGPRRVDDLDHRAVVEREARRSRRLRRTRC